MNLFDLYANKIKKLLKNKSIFNLKIKMKLKIL